MIPQLERWLHIQQDEGGVLVDLLKHVLPSRSIGQWQLSWPASVVPIAREISALAHEPSREGLFGYGIVAFAPAETRASPIGLALVRDDFLCVATGISSSAEESFIVRQLRLLAFEYVTRRHQDLEWQRVKRSFGT